MSVGQMNKIPNWKALINYKFSFLRGFRTYSTPQNPGAQQTAPEVSVLLFYPSSEFSWIVLLHVVSAKAELSIFPHTSGTWLAWLE